ncbi:hypothetical protein DFH06DRAFT_295238 [Mycena polygramma]|nr:hypothetical protein DFH06DRAFT_295238 [Mycena polygramma]
MHFDLPNLKLLIFSLRCPPSVKKARTQSEDKLCNALNLGDRLSIFNGIKQACHKLVDQHFNVWLPSNEQEENMELFVQRVIEAFPGYFNDSHANEQERIASLQAYTANYLDGKVVELESRNKTSEEGKSWDAHPLPTGDTIKVIRPKPRPLSRSPKRSPKKRTEVVEEITESPAFDALSESMDTDLPSDVDLPFGDESRPASCVVSSAEPSPEPSPEAAGPTDHLVEFLESCCPSMVRCVQSFRRAGINEKNELVGVARWSEDRQRSFLKKQDIARTALEEEALLIGFSCILSDPFYA